MPDSTKPTNKQFFFYMYFSGVAALAAGFHSYGVATFMIMAALAVKDGW
jgi:hypothetical protein